MEIQLHTNMLQVCLTTSAQHKEQAAAGLTTNTSIKPEDLSVLPSAGLQHTTSRGAAAQKALLRPTFITFRRKMNYGNKKLLEINHSDFQEQDSIQKAL